MILPALSLFSSLDFEECAHKLIKNMVEGMEVQCLKRLTHSSIFCANNSHKLVLYPSQGEVTHMLIECCSQERSYLRFYGLLGQRLCLLNQVWVAKFDEAFQQQVSIAPSVLSLVSFVSCKWMCMLASYPGHSQLFNVTLKTWEWPGDKAIYM